MNLDILVTAPGAFIGDNTVVHIGKSGNLKHYLVQSVVSSPEICPLLSGSDFLHPE